MTRHPARVGLVACVKSKQSVAAPAAELYTSALFRGGRAAVESSCDRWFILSAKHGLLAPDTVVEPYELTLSGAARDTKRMWSRRVLGQLEETLGSLTGLTFEIHAGLDYHGWGLSDGLRTAGALVELPTEGLALGGKLAHYAGRRTDSPSASRTTSHHRSRSSQHLSGTTERGRSTMDETMRRDALDRLYELLAPLAALPGQGQPLATLTSRDVRTNHGVYLFTEPGEFREDGATPRIVRVGTHALTATSKATLWSRLRAHRGSVGGANAGGGSHRSSVFRLHVGTALLAVGEHPEAPATWGVGSSAPADVRAGERELEMAVSARIGAMPVFWLDVPDREERGLIERGCIALLSNAGKEPVDAASPTWLGATADREAVRRSGLWNVNHVDEEPDGDCLELVGAAVARTLGAATLAAPPALSLVAVTRKAEQRYLDGVRQKLHALDNAARGAFAEDLVATVLPGATTNPTWHGHDIDWNGIRIEVKTSGAHQAWHDEDTAPSRPTWTVPERIAWDHRDNSMAAEAARTAHVYVLCRHEGRSIDSGWTFYVLPTSALDELGQSSLSHSTLTRLGAPQLSIDELPAAISAASSTA